MRRYATSLLGVPERAYVPRTVWRWKRARVNGQWIRRRVRVRVRVLVANPTLAKIVSEAEDARRASPDAIDCASVAR